MIVQFVNQQNKYKPLIWCDLLRQTMSLALESVPWTNKLQGRKAEPTLTIYLVGPQTMRRINHQTRSIDATTDVLSFPLLDMHDGKPVVRLRDQDYEHLDDGSRLLPLGDIFICLDKAFAQADEFGQTAEREIAFLAVHGLLHLLGYDHDTPEREKSMRRKQRQILKTATQREILQLA